jgi:hypothetical protein
MNERHAHAHDSRHERGSVRRPTLLLVLGLALVAVGVLSATAASRGGSAKDDGPHVTHVGVRVVARPFADEDSGAAPLVLDREVTIDGQGFTGTSFGPFVHFIAADGSRIEALMVVLESGQRIVAWPPPGVRGQLRVVVENPDQRTANAKVDL